ncbi:MAG: HEAT repeat domain-containing protein [Phycisphaerae bacterium]
MKKICLAMCILTVSCWFLLPGCSSKKTNQQETETSSATTVSQKNTQGNAVNADSAQPSAESDTAAKSRISRQERAARRRQERLTAADTSAPKHKSLASLLKQSSQNNTDDGELDFAEETDEQIISKALYTVSWDKDKDNRISAIDELHGMDIKSLLAVIEKGMKDSDSDVRLAALALLDNIDDESTFDRETESRIQTIISDALFDKNEDVRINALMTSENMPYPFRLNILAISIFSAYPDVKQMSISQLTDLSTPACFEILICGLQDADEQTMEDINFATDFLVSQEFSNYNEAKQWWENNKSRFDEALCEVHPED